MHYVTENANNFNTPCNVISVERS